MRLYVYRISTRCYGQELKQRLTNLRDQDKLPLQLQEEAHEGLYSVRCTFATPLKKDRDAELFGQIQRYYFVQALADALQQCAERQCILKHLKKEYAWSDRDIEERGDWVIARLNAPEHGNKALRAKELMRGLFNCVESEPALNLEGFFTFRTATYQILLERHIAEALSDLAFEEEEQDTAALIRQVLSHRPVRCETLHMKIGRDGKPLFWTPDGESVVYDDEDTADLDISEEEIFSEGCTFTEGHTFPADRIFSALDPVYMERPPLEKNPLERLLQEKTPQGKNPWKHSLMSSLEKLFHQNTMPLKRPSLKQPPLEKQPLTLTPLPSLSPSEELPDTFSLFEPIEDSVCRALYRSGLRRLVVHTGNWPQGIPLKTVSGSSAAQSLLDLLTAVFEGDLIWCKGCPRCRES